MKPLKAFKIGDAYIAAYNEPQAIGTWAAHFEEDWKTAPKCEKVNPKKVVVHYEQNNGKFKPGKLSEIMPGDDSPTVLLDGEND